MRRRRIASVIITNVVIHRIAAFVRERSVTVVVRNIVVFIMTVVMYDFRRGAVGVDGKRRRCRRPRGVNFLFRHRRRRRRRLGRRFRRRRRRIEAVLMIGDAGGGRGRGTDVIGRWMMLNVR